MYIKKLISGDIKSARNFTIYLKGFSQKIQKEATEMKWTPDLSVGIEKIDGQHQEMFKMAEQLFSADNAAKGAGFFE